MKSGFKRISGIILVLIAAISLLVSLFALVQVWRYRQPVISNLQSSLGVISDTLTTTSDGLTIAGQSLDSLQGSVTALEGTVDTLGKAIQDSTPMMQSLTVLVGKDLPNTITSAQTSLTAAQQSAKIIDTVLRTLSTLTFNPSLYNPPVPLDVALGQVSQSMDGLPKSLQTMELSLKTTQGNMAVIKVQIDLIAQQIGQINASLDAAQAVIIQYEALVAQSETGLHWLQARMEGGVNGLAWGLSFLLFWLGAFQFGAMMKGWEWARSPS